MRRRHSGSIERPQDMPSSAAACGDSSKARGSRAQLSAMAMPRHAGAEAQDVVRALLDQVAAA